VKPSGTREDGRTDGAVAALFFTGNEGGAVLTHSFAIFLIFHVTAASFPILSSSPNTIIIFSHLTVTKSVN
jgi:hypothetical protein